jgi:hypothetical protein
MIITIEKSVAKTKKHRSGNKLYHQIFIDGQCIGALKKHRYGWSVCRVQGWDVGAESRKDAVRKLLEYKGVLSA